jgi:hypothetical protein
MFINKFKKSIIAAALLVSCGAQADMVKVYYNDFSDTSELQLNGEASVNTPNAANELSLTSGGLNEAGSAFSLTSFTLPDDASFSAFFSFNMVTEDGVGAIGNEVNTDGYGGDGLTFTLQTVSNTAGSQGGGLGYNGLDSSVGIEFDTWNNENFSDISDNHAGINLDGSMESLVSVNEDINFNNGDSWYVWVDYDGYDDLLSVRYSLYPSRPEFSSLSYTVDLVEIFNSNDVYVGFTGSSGGAAQTHNIEQFAFENQYVTLVEQGSVADVNANGGFGALLGAGLITLGLRRRKK